MKAVAGAPPTPKRPASQTASRLVSDGSDAESSASASRIHDSARPRCRLVQMFICLTWWLPVRFLSLLDLFSWGGWVSALNPARKIAGDLRTALLRI